MGDKFDSIGKWISNPRNQQFILDAGKQIENIVLAKAALDEAEQKKKE